MTTTPLVTAERTALEFLALSALRVDERFASRLPTPENLDAIRADVAERGILTPLLTTKDSLLLDGHTRLALARELGIEEVPVLRLPVVAAEDWTKTIALALNVHRRHLTAAQRAQLVTSLEKIEREKAKARKRAAGGDRKSDHAREGIAPGNSSPERSGAQASSEEGRAATRAAAAAGISRKTYERAKRVVAEAAPEVAQKMLSGELSVAAAHKQVQAAKAPIAPAVASIFTPKIASVVYRDLGDVPGGGYRCLCVDPPWGKMGGSRAQGMIPDEEIAALDLARLVAERGSHLWLWTTWTAIQTGLVRELLDRWGYSWRGQIVWHHGRPRGDAPRDSTEVLVFALRGVLGVRDRDVPGFLDAPWTEGAKPAEARALIERCSPGPRLDVFAKEAAPGWDAVVLTSLLRTGGTA